MTETEKTRRGDAIRTGCAAYIKDKEAACKDRMSDYRRYMAFDAFKAGFTAGSQWTESQKGGGIDEEIKG